MTYASQEASRDERVLDVRKILAVARRRLWVIASVTVLGMLIAVAVVLLTKRMYVAQVTLLLSQPQSTGLSMASPIAAAFGLGGLGEGETHAQLLRSKFIIEAAAEELGLGLDVTGLEALQKNVSTKAEPGSSLVTLRVKREDPNEAAAIANKIAEIHLDQRSEQVRARASQAARYIEGQLESVQREILETESAVKNYKIEHGIIDLSAETQGKIAVLSTLETESKKAKAERQAASSLAGQYRRSLSEQSETHIASSVIARNPLVQELEADLAKLELDRAGAVANQGPEHPQVKQFDQSIEKAKQELADAVKTVVREKVEAQNPLYLSLATELATAEAEAMAAAAKDRALSSVLAAEYGKLSDVPAHEYELAKMLRDEKVSQEVYIALFAKYHETRLMEIMGDPGIYIVAEAKPPERPDSRKGVVKLVVGLMLGLIFGGLSAVWLELRDPSLRPEDDAGDQLRLPVLARLPWDRRPPDVAVSGEASPGYLEGLRALRTKLRAERSSRLLCVVGAAGNEGRSTFALNLAAALAQTAQRTLVVDGDMREPRVHEMLSIGCEPGLADVLAGACEIEAAIVRTSLPCLDALPAGGRPLDPNALADTPRAAELLEALGSRYDAIIVDCPPARAGSEALSFAQVCRDSLVVVRPGRTPRSEVEAMLRDLEKYCRRPLGLVVVS